MIPFLQAVAKGYASRYTDFSEFCFLFPNKRSGTFFLKYLKEECGNHVMMAPAVVTITDFVADLSERVVASRLDLLFMLFKAYSELSGVKANPEEGEDGLEFDSFRGWGETVLSDFSEVDQYMVPSEEIFTNVKDYREIATNFLTEEQKEVLSEYFGRTDFEDATKFWKNFDKEDEELSTTKRKFLHLWRIMSPLYDSLNRMLEEKGLATSGRMYRLAVERLRKDGRKALPYKKVIAVGFNALSISENALFKELRDFEGYEGYDDFMDFFWDLTGPVLTTGVNSASKFVKANIKMFPCPEWALPSLRLSDSASLPVLNVVASPSNSAQVKITGRMLAELRGKITSEEINQAKVAVVLPDENLLLPMLYSLPYGMGDVNLTMGYPLKLTSVVPFVTLLRKLHFNMRAVDGSYGFYHKDLRLFLAHPFSYITFGATAIDKILGVLNHEHRAVMSLGEISEISSLLGEIINPQALGESPGEVVSYISRVLELVKSKLKIEGTSTKSNNNSTKSNNNIEADHIEIYRDALRRISDIFNEYKIRMQPQTVFYLTDRLLSGETVGFEGEPLTGLQVMGTLETRSIDFDYLFILSMNERIMPMRARMRTFIPNSLRHAYGMPPANYAESIFAYYFYRMISRAKEVTMIYDARNGGGLSSGDVSRYIIQLRHLFAKGKINEEEWKFTLSGKSENDPSVEKTPEIIQMLNSFLIGGDKRFSASALNDYRECQVRFFYRNVLRINTDPAATEFIDAIGVGNILHSLMEQLYVPEGQRGQLLATPILLTPEKISSMISDRKSLEMLTARTINKLHFRYKGEKLDTPLSGAAAIVGERILGQALTVLKHDLKLAPFRIFGTEIKEKLQIPLKSGKIVNFTFAIDRLDEIKEDGILRLRIVDYKTGKIKLKAADMEEVFSGGYESEQIFQLFTYAWLLGKTGVEGSGNVLTEIYDVPRIFREEKNLPEIGKEVVRGFAGYSEIFSEKMDEMLESIFSSEEFRATEDEDRCVMCALKSLCRR
ncbi:MAG: PD-(D/E)XK nuclease family protein [Muribaculaceae bacterium]|nr:PD-(D/E)XK nuclease family protein [Muribaculaceae bacterium]